MDKKDILQSASFYLWKFSSFMFVVLVIADILILMRILLKDYGEPVTWPNIFATLWIVIPLTIIFYILKRVSKYYWDNS